MAEIGAAEQFVEDLSSFRDSDTFSDFEIVCQGRKWRVHRIILALHSQVFLRACDGEFKEASECRLDLSTHDQDVIYALVTYMYTLNYPSDDDAGRLDARLCVFADMYDMASLNNLATEKCVAHIGHWNESSVSEKLDRIVQLVGIAYSAPGSTGEIRDAVVSKLVELRTTADRGNLDKFREAMSYYPDFAIDLVATSTGPMRVTDPESAEETPHGRIYKCPLCWAAQKIGRRTSSLASVRCFHCPLASVRQDWIKDTGV